MEKLTKKQKAALKIRAMDAAFEADQKSCIDNGRTHWADEDTDAAAEAMKQVLLEGDFN